jgi:hypothetical protein
MPEKKNKTEDTKVGGQSKACDLQDSQLQKEEILAIDAAENEGLPVIGLGNENACSGQL